MEQKLSTTAKPKGFHRSIFEHRARVNAALSLNEPATVPYKDIIIPLPHVGSHACTA